MFLVTFLGTTGHDWCYLKHPKTCCFTGVVSQDEVVALRISLHSCSKSECTSTCQGTFALEKTLKWRKLIWRKWREWKQAEVVSKAMSQATRLSKLGGLLYDVVRCCKHKQTAAKVLDCPEASRFIQLLTEENLSRLRLQAFHVFPRVSTCFHVFPRVSTLWRAGGILHSGGEESFRPAAGARAGQFSSVLCVTLRCSV